MRLGIALMVLALTGCASDSDSGSAAPDMPVASKNGAASPKPVHTLREDLDLPHQVYKKAIEQARKDITNQNARNRLEQIDEQIEREKDMMG